MTAPNYFELMLKTNDELLRLSSWFNSNKLSLNIKKTNYMLFAKSTVKPNHDFELLIDNTPIVRVHETKLLGLVIDDNLNWKSHIDYVSSKIARNIGIIYRLRSFVNKSTSKTLYYSLIFSQLSYCIIIWGYAVQSALNSLVKLQKKVVRILSGAQYLAHTNPLFILNNILKVRDIYSKELLIFMYKAKAKLLPSVCMQYFAAPKVSVYNLRVNLDFVQIFARTSIKLHSVAYTGPRIWNTLPLDLRHSCSLFVFKKRITDHFIGLYKIE